MAMKALALDVNAVIQYLLDRSSSSLHPRVIETRAHGPVLREFRGKKIGQHFYFYAGM